MPTPEQLQKLNTLANFLDDLPHDKFHMPTWCSDNATESSCGTAGCAAGWAATIFHKEGWKINNHERQIKTPTLTFNGHEGVNAFSNFFGLPNYLAYWITVALDNFYMLGRTDITLLPFLKLKSYTAEYKLKSINDITPRHAADRIRKVIKIIDPSFDFQLFQDSNNLISAEKK